MPQLCVVIASLLPLIISGLYRFCVWYTRCDTLYNIPADHFKSIKTLHEFFHGNPKCIFKRCESVCGLAQISRVKVCVRAIGCSLTGGTLLIRRVRCGWNDCFGKQWQLRPPHVVISPFIIAPFLLWTSQTLRRERLTRGYVRKWGRKRRKTATCT